MDKYGDRLDRIAAGDIDAIRSWAEDSYVCLSELTRGALRSLLASLQAAEKRLPAEMPGCTILFRECALGHGRLTATNWVDHGCPWCAIEAAEKRAAEAEAMLERQRRHDGADSMSLAKAESRLAALEKGLREACDMIAALESHLAGERTLLVTNRDTRLLLLARLRTLLHGESGKPESNRVTALERVGAALDAYDEASTSAASDESEHKAAWAFIKQVRTLLRGDGEKPKCGTCGGTKRVPCPDCAAAEKKTEG